MAAFKERMYLRSFQEISKVLSSTLSVDEVLDHIVRQITEVMNLKGATIRLVNPKTNRLELAAAHGLSEKYLKKGTVDLDKSVTEALSGRPVAIFDAVNDPRMQYPQEAKEEGIATLVAIPMVAKGQSHRRHAPGDRGTPGVHHGGGGFRLRRGGTGGPGHQQRQDV